MRIFTLHFFPLSNHTTDKIKPNNPRTKENPKPLINFDLQSQSLQSSMTNFGSRVIQIMDILYIYLYI